MQFVIESNIDTLVLPVAPDVSAASVWGIVRDGLSGVWGGVDMRADETDNPSGDGILWPGVVRAGARYLGLVFAHRSHTSAVAEMQARTRIAGLLRRDLRVIFDGPLGVQETTGFIKAMPEFTHVDAHTCTCGLVIICPDPHWYGLPVVTRGSWGSNTSGGLEYPLYAPGVTTLESRRNLMIYPRTTAARNVAATAAANWSGTAPAVSRIADESAPSDGGYVTRWTAASAGTIANAASIGWAIAMPAATPGRVYTASIWMRASFPLSVAIQLAFTPQGSDATYITRSEGPSVALAPGVWSRVPVVAKSAPDGSAKLRIGFWAKSKAAFPAGATLDLDACLIEQSNVLGDYFDGAMTATDDKRYGWAGAQDASESIEFETVRTGDYSGGYLYYSGAQTGHRVDVPNAGMDPTWPILRVNGATSWARFTCAGQVVEVQAQTEGLTIDTKTGEVTSQGVDVSGFLTRDDFFQIPAGGATVSFQASDPVDFEVEASPAWL